MSLNNELDKHIQAAWEAKMNEGAVFLEGFRIAYNTLLEAGKLPKLPAENLFERVIMASPSERLLDPEDNITLSEFLREYRKTEVHPPLTQEEAARKVGTSLVWFQKMEQGRANPQLGTLTRITHGFGFNPEITKAFIRRFGPQNQ